MRIADPDLQERRRTEILRAAEECFIAKGFHQTSMQDIARTSGASMGLLYRYFKNKAEIIRAFSELDRSRTIAGLEPLADAQDFISSLVKLLKAEFAALRDPNEFRLTSEILSEACRDSVLHESFAASEHRLLAVLAKVIEQQQKAGRVDTSLPPHLAANLTLALVDGLTIRSFLDPKLGKRAAGIALEQSLHRLLAPRDACDH